MAKIGDAPNGENNSLAGTEKIPLTSSKWAYISTVRNFVKALTDTLYSSFNHSHADSDNGGVVNHTVLTGAGTSLHVPTYSSDSTQYLDGNGNWVQPNHVALVNAGTSIHVPAYSSDSTTFLNGKGEWTTPAGSGNVYDSDILFTDNTINNADSDSHGFLLKLSMDTTKYLRADGTWQSPPAGGTVYDSDIVFSDITVNNSSSDEHGFLPKLSGDSDQYLNGDGEWRTVTGGSGALVLLETHTSDSDATLDFTSLSSTYDQYILEIQDLVAVTNGANLLLQVGTGAGPTYDTGSNYKWSRAYQSTGTSYSWAGVTGSTSSTSITVMVLVSSTTPTHATINIKNPNASAKKFFHINGQQEASDAGLYINDGSGLYTQTTVLTALRLLMSSGNIASGSARLYGVAKT